MSALGLIWAQAHHGVIGRDGDMPWYVPEDLAHFKELTRGHPVIMGRRTWESLQVQPLPGRLNIVVSRGDLDLPDGVALAHSIDEALAQADASGADLVWGIGGATLYNELIEHADRVELTEIDVEVDGDTHAPAIGDEFVRTEGEWQLSREGARYRFVTCIRAQ
ncbi:MAG: dihydrofolate reductase [Microbacteriaceae bacterium]